MTLVRCPTHGIPYNDENPRGCPACVQDRKGRKSQARMMRELAEASQPIDDNLEAALRGPTLLERINDLLENLPDASKWLSRIGPFIIAALIVILIFVSGPTYIEQPDPVAYEGTLRPLNIQVGQSTVNDVFQTLGRRDPVRTPGRIGETYNYGTDLIIHVINGYVYSIELGLPSRSWRGLRVGMSDTEASGVLAGITQVIPDPEIPAIPEIRGGWQVYATANSRPIRTLRGAVRPRVGCYDINVQLRPQQTGILADGDQRFSVVASENEAPSYVVTRIIVVDKRRQGPDGDAEC